MIERERLLEIEVRAAAATPGPWEVGDGYGAFVVFPPGEGEPLAIDMRAPDAHFVAHAREDVPALVAENVRLQVERDRLATEVARLEAEAGALLAVVRAADALASADWDVVPRDLWDALVRALEDDRVIALLSAGEGGAK